MEVQIIPRTFKCGRKRPALDRCRVEATAVFTSFTWNTMETTERIVPRTADTFWGTTFRIALPARTTHVAMSVHVVFESFIVVNGKVSTFDLKAARPLFE
jgi:hypothetical protein